MRDFLMEHSYNMVKLFLNQIGLTVFGTMLALATAQNDTLLLISSIFSILFFLVLNYTVGWELGAKDKIRIDAGRLAPMPAKGFFIALGANLPNLILALLMGIGIIINTQKSVEMSLVCNAIARLLNGMYLGTIKLLQDALSADITSVWWWFIIITFPALFVGWLSYYLGSKNFRILSIFGINPKPTGMTKK